MREKVRRFSVFQFDDGLWATYNDDERVLVGLCTSKEAAEAVARLMRL
jgi:hypothetical protein